MSISFADSLKNIQNNPARAPAESEAAEAGIAVAAVIEPEDSIMAYAGEDWARDNKYVWYDEYADQVNSVVDEKKNIVLDAEQFSISQETRSQFIMFEMPRFYDGYDLRKGTILFHFVNRQNYEDFAAPCNVSYSSDKIRFGWLLDERVTAVSGNVRFEIQVMGNNSKNEQYLWKTRPFDRLNIIPSLAGDGIITPNADWLTSFATQINEMVLETQSYAQFAQAYTERAEAVIPVVNNSVVQAQQIVDTAKEELIQTVDESTSEHLENKLADYSTTEQIDEKLDAFTIRYDEPNLKFYNGEKQVESVTIYSNPSTEWSTAYTTSIANRISHELENYFTKEEINQLLENIDISDQLEEVKQQIAEFDGLAALGIEYDGSVLTFKNGEEIITEIEISSTPTDEWTQDFKTELEGTVKTYTDAIHSDLTAYKQSTNADLAGIHSAIDDLPNTLATDYYNKDATDTKFATKEEIGSAVSTAETAKQNVATLTDKVTELQDIVDNIDQSPRLTYEATYDEEYNYTLWEIEGEGDDAIRTPKGRFKIVGGGGGGATSSVLKIEYVTKTPLVATVNDKIEITYNFSGTDSSGDVVLEGQASWRVGNRTVFTQTVAAGENTFDITNYISLGTQKVTLSITDDAGSLVTKSWTVQKVDVRIETGFNDKLAYPIGPVEFDYTPYGAIPKTVHFILDGEEIGTTDTTVSGIPMGFTLPAQTHGAHLLEVYMTAVVGSNTATSNRIFKDILWVDENSTVPVIGTVYQNFDAIQYSTTNIEVTVIDPTTETPTVQLIEDDKVISTMTLTESTFVWAYKANTPGVHNLAIVCGKTRKKLTANIEKLDIELNPVTTGLVFDFDPAGRNNSDADRDWTQGDISLSVSENFDWVNGGYQLDENGDTYFCIKAGTSAVIDYQLFADDAKKNGKEFKLVFKTTNVAQPEAVFLQCIDNVTGADHIGVQMGVHQANIYGQAGVLELPYSENDIIEFEFNISKNTEAVPMIMGYEDGVATRPMVYDDSFNFTQNNPQVIYMGSDDCDVHIYRFKVYNTSLNSLGILNNFIADARSAEEMLDRHRRNQIYDENQMLDPDILAEKCPWLRVYKLSAPYFTNNKSDKVPGTIIQQIYKDGDPILDNWTAYNVMHSGQGTSSNNYGAAGRNLDFIMNNSGIDGVDPYIVLGNGDEVSEITLTRTSVPVAYLNAKVNVASSNHMTNAMLAGRFNEFNPYKRPFIRDEGVDTSFIKDTMEFHNAVIFIQETNEDPSTHREFADNLWHFYALANIGDSKKTDKTRKTDIDDPYEFCVEIMDVELPLSDWPVDTMYNAMGYKEVETTGGVKEKIYTWAKDENLDILYEKVGGQYILTSDEHVDLNKTYYVDILEHDDFSEDYTYGWRYISDDENPDIVNFCKQKWIEFYRFVTTSSDEEFKARLKDYMVVDSALYNFLFINRYTLADNMAKNSFWHYSKTGEIDSDGNPVRKFDLNWAYDMDTSLGLNNYGKQVYRYGLETTDVDEKGEEVFRESDSTFFCRLRDLFGTELKEMYNTLESKNAWHAESFINKADQWQSQFPEELWRLHIERFYIRTYTQSFINGKGDAQFLTNMCNGKMKYHRRQWERSQEKYMASKYQSSVASSDNSVFRCSVPDGDLAVQPNYRLKLTPYAYMYLNVKYGTQSPIQLRARPNEVFEIPFEGSKADIVDVYSASLIQDFGDLSTCYVATADTTKAEKVKHLKFGNDTSGYDNPNFTSLTTGANRLLETLDIQNVSGLTQALDLRQLKNLKELHAKGSNISGVTFADGGKIETAYLPAIGSMTMSNLMYLTTLDIAALNRLTTVSVENCNAVDLVNLLETAPNINRVRLIGVNWVLADVRLLERISAMSGIDRDGYNIDKAVLTGQVHVPVIREQDLYDYQRLWPELEITYDTMIETFAVTFVNDDGTILEVQYVDEGADAQDPSTRAENPITPVKVSSVSHYYVFAGWDSALTKVHANRTIKATYNAYLRTYTIKYVSKGVTLQETQALYGDNVLYTGNIPKYTAEETGFTYYLFDRWNMSGLVTGNKTIEAVFDRFAYFDGAFNDKELKNMRPVEIYAMNKLGLAETVVSDKDEYRFTIGNDVEYDDIESETFISKTTVFNGTNYIDTGVALFDEDKDFVLAIDFDMPSGGAIGSVLAQCFQTNGSNGFQLGYTSSSYSGASINWGSNRSNFCGFGTREVIVLRHQKGSNNLIVYNSNMSGTAPTVMTMSKSGKTRGIGTLVFGCKKADDGAYEDFGKGNIHWAKLWYHDLGDTICRDLAMWTREEMIMEVCGFKKYYLSDNPMKRCSFSLLAKYALARARQWNSSSSNAGGWGSSQIRQVINGRLYKAFPVQVRQLIQQVTIPHSQGSTSIEIVNAQDYVTLPAIIEVYASINRDPYINEGKPISWMTSNALRTKTFANGNSTSYWTRSAYHYSSSYYSNYVYAIESTGYNDYWSPTGSRGIVIQISM